MKKKLILTSTLAVLLMVIWLTGCSEKIVNENGGPVNVAIKTDFPTSTGAQAIEIFTLTVEAEDIPVPITATLTFQDGYLTGTIEVPAGRKRKFTLEAMDRNLTVIYRGSQVLDIYPLTTEITTINIALTPVVPMIKITPHFRQLSMGTVFSFDVEIFNLPNLYSISYEFTHYSSVATLDSVGRGKTLSSEASFTSNIYQESTGQRSIVTAGMGDQLIPLVNSRGYANLGTFYFDSYATNKNQTSIEDIPLYLYLNSLWYIHDGTLDTLPRENVYIDLSAVKLLRKTWELSYGSSVDERTYDIVQTPDGGYAAVGYVSSAVSANTDIYLLKIDSLGDSLWSKTYGGASYDEGYALINTLDGGLVMTGYSYRSNGVKNSNDIALVKTDASGNQIWAFYFGDTLNETGLDVKQTSDGGFIIAGNKENYIYLVKTNAQGNLVWEHPYEDTFALYSGFNAYSVVQASDGGYLVAGQVYYPNESSDAYLMKVGATGNFIWERFFDGGYYNEEFRSISRTSDGNYILTGSLNENIYLAKVNASGTVIWDNEFGDIEFTEQSYAAVQTPDGGYLITGTCYDNLYDKGYQLYLIKTDPSGNTLWDYNFGDYDYDYGYSGIPTSDGGYIACGLMYDYYLGNNLFIVKTDRDGLTHIEVPTK